MKKYILILFISAGIMFIVCPQTSCAQDQKELIKKLINENRILTQENNALKNRIRFLENQLGEDKPVGNSFSALKRIIPPQDIEKNDRYARETLSQIATAAENYAKDNYGSYPASIEFLTETSPPYLKINFCDQTIGGFEYTCDTSIIGYTITATPVEINVTGSSVFTVTTGGVLSN